MNRKCHSLARPSPSPLLFAYQRGRFIDILGKGSLQQRAMDMEAESPRPPRSVRQLEYCTYTAALCMIERDFSKTSIMMRANLTVCNRSTRRWLQLRYCFQPRALSCAPAAITNVSRFHSSGLLSSSAISARNQRQRTANCFKSVGMYRNRPLVFSQRYSSDENYKRSTYVICLLTVC